MPGEGSKGCMEEIKEGMEERCGIKGKGRKGKGEKGEQGERGVNVG